jgi:hypothetical protein
VHLCSESGQLATPECRSTYTEYFVDGSQPVVQCDLHSAPSPGSTDADRSDSGAFDTIEQPPQHPH